MENNRTLHQDSLNHLAEKTASAFLSKADSEPKLKSAQTEFILVRRNKAGLSCLSGFRKDRPVWAPRIQLAQRFRGEDSILAVCLDANMCIKADFVGVEVWPAPNEGSR